MTSLSRIASALVIVVLGGAATADAESLFGKTWTASVTYGPYARASLGAAELSPDNGYWHSPGYPSDPEVRFDLSGDTAATGELALGFDWQNGWRLDLSILALGSSDVSGPCSGTSDGSLCSDHADIQSASVSTRAAMVNVFYAPFEARGSHSVFQPLLVAGVGTSANKVGQWTRYNDNTDATSATTRTFEGARSVSPAWSIGAGASLQVTKPGKWPVIIELLARYYDFGEAQGGATPLPGNGSSVPAQPLTFDNHQTVVALGVRIPMERY